MSLPSLCLQENIFIIIIHIHKGFYVFIAYYNDTIHWNGRNLSRRKCSGNILRFYGDLDTSSAISEFLFPINGSIKNIKYDVYHTYTQVLEYFMIFDAVFDVFFNLSFLFKFISNKSCDNLLKTFFFFFYRVH